MISKIIILLFSQVTRLLFAGYNLFAQGCFRGSDFLDSNTGRDYNLFEYGILS